MEQKTKPLATASQKGAKVCSTSLVCSEIFNNSFTN